MAKQPQVFTIITTKRGNSHEISGTLPELIKSFHYTLECGASYAHEKGNAKINMNPKGIASFVKNINNAKSNAAANGCSDTYYTLKV